MFDFVDDLIDGLTLFMNSSNIAPMTIDNPEELSIVQMANLIINTSIKKLNLRFLKELDNSPFRIKSLIDLVKKN